MSRATSPRESQSSAGRARSPALGSPCLVRRGPLWPVRCPTGRIAARESREVSVSHTSPKGRRLMASLTERMVGAAKLDAATYEDVEADATATPQAMLVVVIANLAAGVGMLREVGIGGLLVATLVSLIGWYIWAFITYFVCPRFLPGPKAQADVGQLLRTLGFSASPGLIRVLGLIPGLAWVVSLVAAVWMLVAMVVAVRQALDYETTGRAVLVCLIGWVINIVVLVVLGTLFGVNPAAKP